MKKKVWKVTGGILLGAVLLLAAGVLYLTVREYRPAQVEAVPVSDGQSALAAGDAFSVMTYNVGYGGLSAGEDFFMDGGTGVQPESRELVESNLAAIADIIGEAEADILFLQEVDRDSRRSYHIDELAYFEQELGVDGSFAYNFRCDFIPYPIPPIGKVESGITTMTQYRVESASRIALPESFSWPVKTCNLKRCILETRIPVEGTDRELVLLNFHLEAYDSGEGKIAQSRMLAEKLAEEYAKGNYVIAGGDFNQTLEGMKSFGSYEEMEDVWTPGEMSREDIPEHFSFVMADEYPTVRILNEPYSGNYEDSQVYVIDGFIVSDNLTVESVEVINTDFAYTDHQPVKMEIALR
ncbi:MAG: endonuclease [Eubacteriales bacterium]|nr:endonuclease [Eubacteriales bacterium]